MTATFVINLSAEAPVFNVTLGDGVSFSVTSGAQAQPLHHKESHSLGGADRIRPEDIGAQGLFESGGVQFTEFSAPAAVALASARAKTWQVNAFRAGAWEVILPATDKQAGDIVVIRTGTMVAGATVAVKIQHNGYTTTAVTLTAGKSVRYVSSDTSSSGWAAEPVSVHSHTSADISDFTAAVTAVVNAIRPL
jgi:hypothetical protein